MRCSPIILLLFASTLLAQNKVETVGESEYFGEILSNDRDTIIMRLHDSSVIYIPKSSILTVHYNVGERLSSKFWSVGGTIGTPSGLQVVGSYDHDQYGLRISIGLVDIVSGAQLNVFRKFSRSDRFSHEASVLFGFTNERYFELLENQIYYNYLGEYYVGAAYAAHWYGFFGEIGLATSVEGFFRPDVLLQLGYIHELR